MKNRRIYVVYVACGTLTLVLSSWVASVLGQTLTQSPDQGKKWIYASKLPLKDTRASWITEGTKINWYYADEFREVSNDDLDQLKADDTPFHLLTDNRQQWSNSEGIEVLVEYVYLADEKGNCQNPPPTTIAFDEQSRKTAIGQGFHNIIKKASGGILQEVKRPALCTQYKGHTLEDVRANLGITINEPNHEAVGKTNIVTGPEEHLFFAGDVITRKVSQLKYDDATKTISEQQKPGQAFLSLNWMIGDIFSQQPKWSANRIVAKVMVAAAAKPFDTFGVGVGYRFHDGGILSDDNSKVGGFMVFMGSFWVKNQDTSGYKQSFQAGISYSLDTLLGWK